MTEPKRILVTGGRHFDNPELVEQVLSTMPADAILVHGAARGADDLCATWWKAAGRVDEPHPADWTGPCDPKFCKPDHRRKDHTGRRDFCPAAGVRRNEVMAQLGGHLLIAFPGDRGTRDMVNRAKGRMPVLSAIAADLVLVNISEVISRSRAVTPSERAMVYTRDVEQAMGLKSGPLPHKVGMNDTEA